jgi:hypothetical protein
MHLKIAGYKRKFDFEITNQGIWIETSITGGLILLAGNHYVSLETDTRTTEHCLTSFKIKPT